MNKNMLIGLLFLSFGMNLFANNQDSSVYADQITDMIIDHLTVENAIDETSRNNLDELYEKINAKVKNNLALVGSGVMSLDPESPDYFLGFIGDAIGKITGAIKDVAAKAFSGLKGFGKKMFSVVKGGFDFVKNSVGKVAKASVSFIADVGNNALVQKAVGWGAEILLKGATMAAPLTAAIPAVGPAVAAALTGVVAFADNLINPSNVAQAMDLIAAAAGGLKEYMGDRAPSARFFDEHLGLASISAKSSSKDVKPPAGSVEGLMKLCGNFLKYSKTIPEGKITSRQAETIKTCTGFASKIAENMN